MESNVTMLLMDALRVFFFGAVPVVAAAAVAGAAASLLQAVVAVDDAAVSYGARLLGAVAAGYLLFGAFRTALLRLAQTAWG